MPSKKGHGTYKRDADRIEGPGYVCLGPSVPYREDIASIIKQIEFEEDCRDKDEEVSEEVLQAYRVVRQVAIELYNERRANGRVQDSDMGDSPRH